MSDSLPSLCWDDLRVIKAVGESASLAAAAAALELNHSTVSRRLAVVERTLGTVLFDRRRSGYIPTDAGADFIELATRVENDILSVVRRVSGHAQSHTGDLRITTSDALLLDFLTPVIAGFRTRHRGVRIETIVGNRPLNLARGESDIAFRTTVAPPENLFGRKLATVAWAVYGRRIDYDRAFPMMDQLFLHQWVSYGKGLAGLKAFAFVNDRVPHNNIVYRSDSVAGIASAISAGIGIGFLPCMHGNLVDSLVRIGPIVPEVYDELWVLTHPDICKSGRIAAFITYCAKAITPHRDFIEGRASRRDHPMGLRTGKACDRMPALKGADSACMQITMKGNRFWGTQ
ncbi:LysR family transcriptional regulator [Paraburkholderia humisilvae]|nr:LysR family transcriptional regulator [Paraburkholderia humisilvae]